jgi:hypothetical protein
MDHSPEARARRAGRRRETWTIAREEQGPPAVEGAAERVAAVLELSRDAWLFSGQPWPDHPRAEMPITVTRWVR